MALTIEKIEKIAEKLRAMPAVENKHRQASNQEAIKLLAKDIKGMQQRGYTLEQIADILKSNELAVAAPTLRSYLQRAKGGSIKKTGSAQKLQDESATPTPPAME
jgi:uncharacterized protein YpbB